LAKLQRNTIRMAPRQDIGLVFIRLELRWNTLAIKLRIPHNGVKRLFREKIVKWRRETYIGGMGFYLFRQISNRNASRYR